MEVNKQEQRSYIKIAVFRGRNARQCHTELRETLGVHAMRYRTVARWVQTFKRGRVSTSDLPRTARPVAMDQDVRIMVIEQCLLKDSEIARAYRSTGRNSTSHSTQGPTDA